MTDGAVGTIGVGNIGNGVAQNLAKAQKWPVYDWDYGGAKTVPFAKIGNATVATLAEIADAVEVPFFGVPYELIGMLPFG